MVETSLAKVEAELVATIAEKESRTSADAPFRVLLIGDWSGRANRGAQVSGEELKTWRPLPIDRDNLDQLMATLGVRLNIRLTPGSQQSLAINFSQLDDFHPDRLFQRLEIFDLLRRTRAALNSPATFSAAVANVRQWEEPQSPDGQPISPVNPTGAEREDPNHGNVLDRILAASQDSSPSAEVNHDQGAAEASAEISRLAKAVADPYLTPDIDRDQEQMIDAVDVLISALMNSILHHMDFQELESAWRALDLLVGRLETGTDLKLYLLDVSREEFKADLKSNADFRSTALYKLLVEDALQAEDAPWSVIGGNYTFDISADDESVIESVSLVAKAAGAPFIAGVTSDLLGCKHLAATPDPDDWQAPADKSSADSWKRISNLPAAAYVGLALPRFLLRLPYGRDTEPTEAFEFEEISEEQGIAASHESYLWANPVFALVFLLARGFSEDGPGFRPSDHLEIEGLPLHVYQRDGETEIKPCAEVLLTLRAARQIIDHGLMPLLSMKDSDRIRLGMFQSIAGTALRGRWSQEHQDK
jgi:type VI secretion system protein ImpC